MNFPTNIIVIVFLLLSTSVIAQLNCDCDVTITNSNQNFPSNTTNKTICFDGDFIYQLNWKTIKNNTTLCIGDAVTFNSNGLNWPNSGKFTINNYGEFNISNSIPTKNSTLVNNYGKMNAKFSFNGGDITNYSSASMHILSYSNFSKANFVNQSDASLEIESQYTNFGSNFVFISAGDFVVNGNVQLNSNNFSLQGNTTFKKDFTNNSNGNIFDGNIVFDKNVSANGNSNLTIINPTSVTNNLSLWGGKLTFESGVTVEGNTQINGGNSLVIGNDSSFNNLTINQNAELASYTDGCKTVLITGNTDGWNGEINSYNNSSIALNTVSSHWLLSGNSFVGACEDPETIWQGTLSSDANNPNNWSNGLPNPATNAVITNTFNQPILSEDLSVLNLIINENSSLTSNTNHKLSVFENVEGEGDLSFRMGSVNFESTTSRQEISLSGTITLNDIVVLNPYGVALNESKIDVSGAIYLTNGDLITNYDYSSPNQNILTLKSNQNTTAVTVSSNFKIIGDVLVERFIPAQKRAFRYITSSVNTSTSIRENWQEGQNNTSNNYDNNSNNLPGFGTHITGNINGENGFDATLTGNASLFNWDITTSSWKGVTNTNIDSLVAGHPYALLIRGDRSTNLYSSNNATGNPATLRMRGQLRFGQVDVSHQLNPQSNSFSLVGNPYQSQVDFKSMIINEGQNLDKNFYYSFNPNIGSRGGYLTVDLSESPVQVIPASYNSQTSNSSQGYLQPNQAVFVKTGDLNTSPSLVFKEEYKTNNVETNEVFRTSNTNEETNSSSKIDFNVYDLNAQKVVDGVRFKFSNTFNSNVDSNDASKFWNSGTTIGINNNGNYLSIDKRDYPTHEEELNFWIGNYNSSNYRLKINVQALDGYTVRLIDAYTNSTYILENNQINTIDVQVDVNNPESSASNRFKLVFAEESLNNEPILSSENCKVYPNPASNGYFKVTLPQFADNTTIVIYNNFGQSVLSKTVTNNSLISTSGLRSGVYFVEFKSGNYQYKTKLIIK